jgi:phage tail-like protein
MAGQSGRRPKIDYVGAFNFRLEIDGVTAGAFRSVSGLKTETEIFEFREGGDNARVRKLVGPTRTGNIILKKGYLATDDLWKWRKEISDGVGGIKRKSISIVMNDDNGSEICRWNCMKAWPVRWEGPEMDSASGQSSVETIEIAVETVQKA